MSTALFGKDSITGSQDPVIITNNALHMNQYVWDTGTLAWIKQTGTSGGPSSDVNVTNTTLQTSDVHTTAALPLSVRLSDGSSFYNASGGAGGNLATAAKGTTAAGSPTSENTDVNTQSLHTRITNASIPVTGTFWQATQPVSLTSTTITGSVAVTGTFWQATQPVSLASTTITGSVAVTGPLTDTQLRASAVPVSLASIPSHAVTNAGTFAVQVTSAPTTAVTGTFFQATQPVSIASWTGLTDTQLRATAVPVSLTSTTITNTVTTTEAGNSTSAVTSVASSATTVTLKALNGVRKGLSIHNDSTALLYVKLGATASSTSYTVKMAANSYYEVPFGYTGVVDGIWASVNGNALVTEIT